MKVAIASCGPLRTFSKCYQTWIDNIIIPIENRIGKGNVKIFMYNCITDKKYYDTYIKNGKFNRKLGIDSEGSEDIINSSEYIEVCKDYHHNDMYIENIFNEINKFCNTDYNIYDIEKHTVPNGKKKKKFYHALISGICSNYNNKKIVDMIPIDYDLVIKIRPDAYLVQQYPIDTILNMDSNSIYLQVLKSDQPKTNIPKFNLFKKKLLGKRWDNFFMGHNKTLKHLYQNFLLNCKLMIDKYLQEPHNQHDCIPEFLLKNIIENAKIKPEKYFYHGAADRKFYKITPADKKFFKKFGMKTMAIPEDMDKTIHFAKYKKFNWFVLKNDHQHEVNGPIGQCSQLH